MRSGTFHTGCPKNYLPRGGKAQKDIISPVGNTSPAGVLKGHKILFIVLQPVLGFWQTCFMINFLNTVLFICTGSSKV